MLILIIFTAVATKSILPISRILKMMDLKQVGRNYYNENEATEFLNRITIEPIEWILLIGRRLPEVRLRNQVVRKSPL